MFLLAACETNENHGESDVTDTAGDVGDVTLDGDTTDTLDTGTDDTETGDTETGDTETGDTEASDTETGDTETGDTETGDTEVSDTDACGDTCGENEVCDTSGETAVCVCAEGFIDSDDGCIDDPCDGACLENEVCDTSGEAPVCLCPEGYLDTEDACTEIDECDVHEVTFDYDGAAEGATPDCLTDSVCLARSTGGALYNTLADTPEGDGCGEGWPSGTLWAAGDCRVIDVETLAPFAEALDCWPPDHIGTTVCLYVEAEETFFNVTFETWGDERRGEIEVMGYTRTDVPLCGLDATCTNTPGSYECACDEGFDGDGSTCENIDECSTGTPCPETADCYDTVGSFVCSCPAGQFVDAGACADIDECAPPTMPAIPVTHLLGDDPDCITDSVCINRLAQGPVFNSLVDAGGRVDDCESDWGPTGTEWHTGSCDLAAASFVPLGRIGMCRPNEAIGGKLLCLHTIDDDRYFEVNWTHWGVGEDGGQGQFSYERTEVFPGCGPGATCAEEETGYSCTCGEGLTETGAGCISETACVGDPCGAGNTCFPKPGGGFGCVCEGSSFDFEKSSWGDEEDCILPGFLCITRGDDMSIYNTAAEPYGSANRYSTQPSWTFWTSAPCESADVGDFYPFFGGLAEGGDVPAIVDVAACMIAGPSTESPVWVDITFTRWDNGSSAPGGGFAYTRENVVFDEACPALD